MGFIREIMGMKEPTGLISRVLKTGKMDETISMTSVNAYTLCLRKSARYNWAEGPTSSSPGFTLG